MQSISIFASLTAQLYLCLSNGQLWLIIHYHFLTFSHIPCKSVITPVIYHGRDIGHCVYIFSSHMDTILLFLLLIAVYINLVDLTHYPYKCIFVAFHYNKWNVRVFCIWSKCVCITPNELFYVAPDFKKKVYIFINISWIIFLFPYDIIIHNEHVDR